jgi:SAM-dependent methyltransferase
VSRTTFDHVAAAYDAARPDYPGPLFDAIESALGQPLLRATVADIGAGTGIASRALAGRGARVVAVDPGPVVLAVLLSRSTSRISAVVGDGNALPLRSETFDLVTYAQSWHWTDPSESAPEAARVLHDRGVLATFWNVMTVEDQPWWQRFAAASEAANATYDSAERDMDWGASIEASGCFAWVRPVAVPWTRTVPVESLVTDYSSHSYVAELAPDPQKALLDVLRSGLLEAFPGGVAVLPYVTRLWVARR